jgi:RhtB (resistance to homoserine/threonine) family protein
MTEILAVMMITVLAVISPGPDFAMVTRNSYLFGRQAGLLTALGIALGVQVHVAYTMLGVAVLVTHSPKILLVVKLIGAAYLIYIGLKTAINQTPLDIDQPMEKSVSRQEAFKTGFLSNALNPKTMLFVVSIYSQVIHPDTGLMTQFAYGLFISAAHLIWFSLVAVLFTHVALRTVMLRKQRLFNRAIGTVLAGLGAALAASNL